MQFTTSIVAAVLAFTSSVAASPLEARQSAMKDFQVTSLSSHSPSGRPGTYPFYIITANITDPNEINFGPTNIPAGSKGSNCAAIWFTKNGETPLGRTWPCDFQSGSYWYFEVLAPNEGTFSVEAFDLKFTHVADVLYQGTEYTATYQAQGYFAVGKNMTGTCGGSGVCNWELRADSTPALLPVKKV